MACIGRIETYAHTNHGFCFCNQQYHLKSIDDYFYTQKYVYVYNHVTVYLNDHIAAWRMPVNDLGSSPTTITTIIVDKQRESNKNWLIYNLHDYGFANNW